MRAARRIDWKSGLPAPLLLIAGVVLGCASSPDPEDQFSDPTDAGVTFAETRDYPDGVCRLKATVDVRVDNRSSTDVRIWFGSYSAARLALGFTRTIYQVPRVHLQGDVRIDIEHGGLQIGTPPPVPTEPVVCNVATLVIGARPRYSVFYGDALPGDSWDDVQPDRGGGAGEDSEE